MAAIRHFLSPSRYKIIFILCWLLYSIVAVLQNRFDVMAIGINLLWPMVLFYLLGCSFVSASRTSRPLFREWQLIAAGVSLAALDHASKIAVIILLPVGESLPVVLNRLHLVQVHNVTGSWIFATLGSAPVVLPAFVLSVILLLCAPLFFRFYSVNHRQSFWSSLAFVCLVACSLSNATDLGFRGYVVDYLYIPGLFAADFKDLLSEIVVASALIEALDNPRVSFRWNGWRDEFGDLLDFARRIFRFAASELLRFRRSL